ncbi:MAG: HflK protein [Gammaproteobacteria bacterium TMED95]|jgi:membrane protease subunit HflK|nr:FtsH protease activity modulator HflK [Gammaproteobacteria bacterium]OUV21111.1 MAG: HflK protein [Gammaproteobacteria bacterium TMED95]|tara:strand:- start:215 stop:1345 length:1131 start_codon:yes stop_codon:yes gene_type:complete
MAWNEPGNNGDRDPWGNRQDQGPPDLDEAFKKLKDNLGGMFGGGSSSGGSTGGGMLTSSVLGVLAAVAAIGYGLMGIYTLDEQERGVVLRFGQVQEAVVMPGLSWYPPIIDKVLIHNVSRVRSHPHDSEMLTEDENIVKVKLTVQYVIDDVVAYALEVRDPEKSLHQSTESAVRHVVGSTEMDEVLTEGRAVMGDEIKTRIQDYMAAYGTGIAVTQVNVDETAPPDAVREAFDEVIRAREDEVRVRNEADAYANQVIPEARGEAQRYLEEAEGYRQRVVAQAVGEASRFSKLYVEYKAAPEVTRERMYIDTMEAVMSSASKVMVDVEGGNNMMYLPLDRMIQQGSTTDRGQGMAGADSISQRPQDRSSVRSRRDRQ